MADDIVLSTFGPNRPVPPGHRWCMACDGSGKGYAEDDSPVACEVCKGKGHWNIADIKEYHTRHPQACRDSCGGTHFDDPIGGDRFDQQRFEEAMERTQRLLEKYEKDDA